MQVPTQKTFWRSPAALITRFCQIILIMSITVVVIFFFFLADNSVAQYHASVTVEIGFQKTLLPRVQGKVGIEEK